MGLQVPTQGRLSRTERQGANGDTDPVSDRTCAGLLTKTNGQSIHEPRSSWILTITDPESGRVSDRGDTIVDRNGDPIANTIRVLCAITQVQDLLHALRKCLSWMSWLGRVPLKVGFPT